MRKIMFIAVAIVALWAVAAFADKDMTKDQACDLIGSCAFDLEQTAQSMQVECDKMMKQAQDLTEKGKLIRGRGELWQDKDMIQEGMKIYDQGQAMYEKAKNMSDACALMIKNAEETKKKYKPADPNYDSKTKKSGDFTPPPPK